MKNFIATICFLFIIASCFSQDKSLNIIIFGAHPDDCDIDAGGTALLFSEMGHRVKFVSLTNGDAGHYELSGEALAAIRFAEAKEAGRRFGVAYTIMNNDDGKLMPTLENRLDVIREIRNWNADVVIAPRPNDYHPDHRYTGILVQDAAYMVIVPNIAADTPPLKRNPVFLYSHDRFQEPAPFKPDIPVVIDAVFEKKIYAMAAHESQFFDWLPWTQGTLDKIPKDEKARLEMLAEWRYTPHSNAMKESLKKWYGAKGVAAKHTEGFQICEYGRQPSDAEIKELFPMLGKL